MRSNPLLKTFDLAVGYSTHTLFEKLNLELNSGELVCFMGPNGIGKSSLIKTLIGILKPLSGTYTFNGNSPLETNVAVVLTDRIHHPQLLVKELLTLGRYPYLDWRLRLTPSDEKKVKDAVELTHIQSLYDKRIAELSDGQMQMVMIARALAQDTPVILLDEPTAHLDLNNRVEIMNLLKRLTRKTNRAILIATHELDLALQCADVVWLATSNKSIKTGIPEDLVLDGSFDDVFQFKGYDLKTGKIQQSISSTEVFKIIGSDFELLWTKNAFERNGFRVSDEGNLKVEISLEEKRKWTFSGRKFSSLDQLLSEIKSNGTQSDSNDQAPMHPPQP